MNWTEQNNTLVKQFTFPTFMEAISFVNKVANIAEELQHHPSILVEYTKVTFTLSTHDLPALPNGREQAGAGDVVTDKDHALAARIDTLI